MGPINPDRIETIISKNSFSTLPPLPRRQSPVVGQTALLPLQRARFESEETNGKEPKINRFRQNKHAISQSRTRRSGDWRLPWGLSHHQRNPFPALTSQS